MTLFVALVATGLCIPPVLLGFGATVGDAGIDGPKVVSWVDRRDFVQHVAALAVGVSLASYQGEAQYTLAVAGHDPHAAGRAVPLLGRAVDHLGAGYARLRALNITDLAGAHAIAGDTDTAVTIGHQAVDAVTAVSSRQAYDRLRVLNTVLEPLHDSAGVAELRDRPAATAA